MNAEILCVGTELLLGQILNTNSQYISSKLPEIGINTYFQSVVGDNPTRIKSALKIALERSDLIIMTGGLGPTQDDITKETVADFFGKNLVIHSETLEQIQDYFNKINKEMIESNKKQAYVPEDSTIIVNKNGTAPGFVIEEGQKIVVILPGPPHEMIPMFDDSVLPYLKNKSDKKITSKYINIFGLGESFVESKITDLISNSKNITLATYVKHGMTTIRITTATNNDENPDLLLNPLVDEIEKRFGKNIFSTDNTDLNIVVGQLLIEKNIKLSMAESCTGGYVSTLITSVPGISEIFEGGVVSYSNKSKMKILHVNEETINKFGAVSSETALEMAVGVMKAFNTDLGIGITGIAGPSGGSELKPVGLVYLALADENSVDIRKLNLIGDREKVRILTAMNALDMIRLKILKKN